jgi:hypothetical protein
MDSEGPNTPQSAYRNPLLRILKRHPLGTPRLNALRELEIAMLSGLTKFDRSDIRSGTVRWQKSAEWEVSVMRKEGLIEPVSKSGAGQWKLTLAGQQAANDLGRV